MAYTPDATNSAAPADAGIQASTAAAEFRAIKVYYLAQFALRAPLASPIFTGVPIGTTAAVDTATTQLATTAYVINQLYLKAATATATYATIGNVALKAPIDSPTFTGTPASTTAAVDTNTTRIATTAYVINQLYLKAATAAATYETIANVALKAPLASPVLTGVPTAPTAAVDTATTQLATTSYVINQSYLKAATATATYAPLASPNFSGTPTIAGIEIGYRKLVAASVTTGAFVAADSGKCVYATSGVTVPNATMAQGDLVTIYNTTAGTITITLSVATPFFNGLAAGASKTLAAHGECTVHFGSSTECQLSGNLS